MNTEIKNSTEALRVRIYSVQVARGSAVKYAWSTTRLVAVVGPLDTIIAATGRLLSWKSGNSSRTPGIYISYST